MKDRFVLPTFWSECSDLLQGEDEARMKHLSLYSLASHQVLSLGLSVGTTGLWLDTLRFHPEEGQSTLTEMSARQTCLSHAGIREPNFLHVSWCPFCGGKFCWSANVLLTFNLIKLCICSTYSLLGQEVCCPLCCIGSCGSRRDKWSMQSSSSHGKLHHCL